MPRPYLDAPSPRRAGTIIFGAATLMLVSGCASLSGRRITAPSNGNVDADGYTYFLSKPSFALDIKALAGDKKATPAYDIKVAAVADASQRFEVGVEQGFLASTSLKVTLDTDGRLLAVNAKAEDNAIPVIKALGDIGVAAARIFATAAAARVATDFENAITDAVNENAITPDQYAYLNRLDAWVKKNGEAPTEAERAANKETEKKVTGFFITKEKRLLADAIVRTSTQARMIADAYVRLDALEATFRLAASHDADRAAEDAKAVSDTIVRLKNAVITALAAAAAAPTDEGKLKTLDTAVEDYRNMVRLIVKADLAIGPRALEKRRKVLLDFLQEPIKVTNKGGKEPEPGTIYPAIRDELEKVDAAIAGLLGTKKEEDKTTPPLGTTLTNSITAIPALYIARGALPSDRAKLPAIAKAWMRFGREAWLNEVGVGAGVVYFQED